MQGYKPADFLANILMQNVPATYVVCRSAKIHYFVYIAKLLVYRISIYAKNAGFEGLA